jgi:AAA+ ATPase superfamily predicted ATPase
MFINRSRELEDLATRWQAGRPELVVLYGRRRVGKTALLREFSASRPHAFFLAARTRDEDALRQMTAVLHEASGDEFLATQPFTSWEAVLTWLGRLWSRQRFLVVLDEFPNLCLANPALPSILQVWWDRHAAEVRPFLALCGSQVGFMEDSVLAERAPLFGRRSGQMRLGPLTADAAGRFFPGADVRGRLLAYAVAGGIPAYLERLAWGEDFERALLREAFQPEGFLFDEVTFLLKMELQEPATYLSLLLAVASGATRQTEIADRARLPVTAVNRYLQTLVRLGFVERRVPLLEPAPEHSRKGLYFLADPFTRFWCRFVLPYQGLIADRQGEAIFRRRVQPQLDAFVGPIFEDICHGYVRRRWLDRTGRLPVRLGRQWSAGLELDLLAELDDGSFLAGECKSGHDPVGPAVLRALADKVATLPTGVLERSGLAVFSASGFTAEAVQEGEKAGVELVDGGEVLEMEG